MFCPNCGKEVPQEAAFCPYCGKLLPNGTDQSQSTLSQGGQPEQVQSQPRQPQQAVYQQRAGVSENERMSFLIGKNQAYYFTEFSKLQAGEKAKFNWAAFFLSGSMCFYRRCGKLFVRYFLPPMCALLVASLLALAGTVMMNFTLTMVGAIASIVASVFMLVNLIRFGLNFNKEYYSICLTQLQSPPETDKPGTSVKNMVLYWVVCFAVVLVLSLASSAIATMVFTSMFF